MTANVETMAYFGKAPWWVGIENGTAIALDGLADSQAIREKVWPWDVQGSPVFVNGGQVPGFKALTRSDNGHVLGIVRDSYRPVQNEEVTGFADALVASSDAKFETAGVLGKGETVWALAHLPKHVQIAGDPSEIKPYLLVYAGHNGHCALTAKLTMIRVVCSNTMDASIRGAGAQYKVRHTTRFEGRLSEARNALGMALDYVVAFEQVANDLARHEMTMAQVVKFTEKLLPTRGDPDKAVLTKKSRDEIAALFAHSDTLTDVAPTAYRLYNAVTEWTDHYRVYRATKKNSVEDNRAYSLLSGQTAAIKDRALTLLTPKGKVLVAASRN